MVVSSVFAAGKPGGHAAVALLLFVLFGTCTAQQHIGINHLRSDRGRLHLTFTLSCDNTRLLHVDPQNVRLQEDALPVRDFTLRAPEIARAPVCAILVFDASGSMGAEGVAGAKNAGHAFIDMMDGMKDRAAIMWFGDTVTLAQHLTSDRKDLHAAMDRMPRGGGTALWDACFQALQLLAGMPDSVYRSLIVLSDGTDNSSSFTGAAIENEANRLGVYVNSVSLWSGWSGLSSLAFVTGGLSFYTDTPDDLAGYYTEIFREMRDAYGEFILTWEKRTCDDGKNHSMQLDVDIPCSSSYTATRSFRADLDSAAFAHMPMHLGNTFVQGGQEATTTLWLDAPVDTTLLYDFSFRLHFDTDRLQLQRIDAPPGTLLHGMNLSSTDLSNGARVTVTGSTVFSGVGAMADITFLAHRKMDTAYVPVDIYDWEFEAGCLRPEIAGGHIGVFPPTPHPLIACEIFAPSVLGWERSSGDYTPNPFSVSARFLNAGGETARNARFAIAYDSSKLHRILPAEDTIAYAASDITTGSHGAVAWDLWTPRLLHDDTTEVTITAMFDNHPPVTCRKTIVIPRADAVLACELHTPEFWSDPARGRFGPMPFPVSAVIRNIGGRTADPITAGIVLPDSMMLAGADAPDRFQKSPVPPALAPGDSAVVAWMLKHPPVRHAQSPQVQVIVQSSSTAASSCSAPVNLPAIDLSPFHFTLTRKGGTILCEGDSLLLDASSGRDSWRWNTGDSTRTIVVREGGTYYCEVRLGNRTGYSDTVHVTVREAPQPALAISGSLPLCAGDSLLLDAGEGYAAYAWNTGAATRVITVTLPGAYWVRVTDEGGCTGSSDTVEVNVVSPPRKPDITRIDDKLIVDSAGALQWFHDGSVLEGENARTLTLLRTGTYHVRVTDANGCTAESEPFDVRVLGVADLPAAIRSLSVFPNPAGDMLQLRLSLRDAGAVRVSMTDMLGRVVIRQLLHPATVHRSRLDLGALLPGVYVLRIEAASAQVSRMIIRR